MSFEIITNDNIGSVDWQRLADILELSGLNRRDLAKLERGFTHSQFRYLGYLDGELIACARAISDLTSASYLSDVAIHPDYQGRGFGGALMRKVMQDLTPFGKVIIYAVPDKIEFYKRFNFHPLLTAMTYAEGEALAFLSQKGYIPSPA